MCCILEQEQHQAFGVSRATSARPSTRHQRSDLAPIDIGCLASASDRGRRVWWLRKPSCSPFSSGLRLVGRTLGTRANLFRSTSTRCSGTHINLRKNRGKICRNRELCDFSGCGWYWLVTARRANSPDMTQVAKKQSLTRTFSSHPRAVTVFRKFVQQFWRPTIEM